MDGTIGEPVATTEKSQKIEAISKETIHHICSGQVRLSMYVNKKYYKLLIFLPIRIKALPSLFH